MEKPESVAKKIYCLKIWSLWESSTDKKAFWRFIVERN